MYSKGDLGITDIDGICVMPFFELNKIINKQYPGYRDKTSGISLLKGAVGGSMGFDTLAKGAWNNASEYLNGSGSSEKEVIASPPLYDNDVKLPT
tara:strand:- start:24 stop:308 length:285 start_codon:yes stop_codon:yes gene_type:complete